MKSWRLRWVSPFNIIVSSCSVVWEAFCGTLLTCVMMITGVPSSILRDRLDPHWASVGSKQASHPWEHEDGILYIPFHLSKEQSAPFWFNTCWLMTSRMVRVWLGGYRLLATTILLLPYWREVHSLRVQRLAQCRACLFWGKCICLFWNNYYLLYCPVQSHTFFSFPHSLVWQIVCMSICSETYKIGDHIVSCNGGILSSPTKCEDCRWKRQTEANNSSASFPR